MNFLLEITASDYTDKIINTKGPMETLLFGLQMLGIGMLAVFSVLCLIWLALAIFQKVFAHDSKPRVERIVEETPVAAPAVVQQTSDDEIVAVIAAAIAAAESERPGMKFRVVSFNRR